ncbi:MAG: hypothetical protein ACJART_002921 [Maribacter sp.]|jgi:hypothetical protein
MIYPTVQKANATRLMGGNPPCQSEGSIQPLYPIKKICDMANSMAISKNLREVINLINILSSLRSVLNDKLIFYFGVYQIGEL